MSTKPKIALFFTFLWMAAPLFAADSKNYFEDAVQYFNSQQFSRAVLFLKKTVKLEKNNWKAYQLMGDAYLQLGLTTDGLEAYQQSLRIHPQNKTLRNLAQGLESINSQTLKTGYQEPLPPAKKSGPRQLELEISAGLPNFTDSVGSAIAWQSRYNLGLRMGYWLSPQLSIGGQFDYFNFNHNFPYQAYYGNTDIIQILPYLKFDPFNKQSVVHPYLLGGIGYLSDTVEKSYIVNYLVNPNLYTLVPGYSVNACSLMIGVGIPMPLFDEMGISLEVEQIFTLGSNEAVSLNNWRLGYWVDL